MSAKKKEETLEAAKDGPVFSRPNASTNLFMGIVGLPNVGKSTLFNRLTNARVAAENYPYCTIDPSVGEVTIEDERVKFLASVYKPKKTTYAHLTIVDIAGLMKGASTGEGLGNQFLSHIRGVDGIFLVVRCFEDPNITHVLENTIDPLRDIEVVRDELREKDFEWTENIIQTAEKKVRANPGNKQYEQNLQTAKKLRELLKNSWISDSTFADYEIAFINTLNMLTTKPVVILANISAKHYAERKVNKHLKAVVQAHGTNVIPFSAAYGLSDGFEPFPEEFVKKVVSRGYAALGLINFFTVGKDEVRSWTIRKGAKAPDAGAVIHSDFKHYFICAEVMEYATFVEHPSESQMRSIGKYLQKGKDYVVNDGDIIYFKQNASKAKKK